MLTLADEKTARTMPAHFLLTTEVNRPEDLEYADFLLSDQPKARLALDLLLGTQGWRRFAPQDPAQPREAPRDDADRLLVILGRSSPRVTELAQKETEQLRGNSTTVKNLCRRRPRKRLRRWLRCRENPLSRLRKPGSRSIRIGSIALDPWARQSWACCC